MTNKTSPEDNTFKNEGLTKREQFASYAMLGLLANQVKGGCQGPEVIASLALNTADELIKLLNQRY
jgi:hypothetical protein